MSNNKSASFEARLKNNKDLLIAVTGYEKYQPVTAEIRKENFAAFLAEAETAMTELKESMGALTTTRKVNTGKFSEMVNLTKKIRLVISEMKGSGSSNYENVNSLVNKITGQNIQAHSKRVNSKIKALKEGETGPEVSSVSQLDQKSRLGNFRELIGLLKSYDFYIPDDETLRIESLEAIRDVLTSSLEIVAEKETNFVNGRSRVKSYFEGSSGLSERARRAKMHVKRKYGSDSPEYMALVNKNY